MNLAQWALVLGLVVGVLVFWWAWRQPGLYSPLVWRVLTLGFIAWGIAPAILTYRAWLPASEFNIALVLIYFSMFVVGAPFSLMWRRLRAFDA